MHRAQKLCAAMWPCANCAMMDLLINVAYRCRRCSFSKDSTCYVSRHEANNSLIAKGRVRCFACV